MRRFTFFILTLSALSLLFSCTRLAEQPDIKGDEIVFSVSAELVSLDQEAEEVETKGYLGSFIGARWNQGDKLSVVNLTKGKVLGGSLVSDRAGVISTFSGAVSGTISAGDVIALFYPPFENTGEVDFDTRLISLANQYKESKVPLVTYSTFVAEKTGTSFTDLNLSFIYVLSYLKINMSNLPSNAAVSKVTLRNIPEQFSVSIKNTSDGFDIAPAGVGSGVNKIEISGSYQTNGQGNMSASVGVMPSEACDTRSIVVSVDGDGDYMSPLTSAKLSSHNYYNTIVGQFELVGLSGEEQYGVYDMENRKIIDKYEEFKSTVITGIEKDEADFTLLNPFTFGYWTVKGIPSDISEGSSFTARVLSSNTGLPSVSTFENAKVIMEEADGEYAKLWIKSGNTLFIVRK